MEDVWIALQTVEGAPCRVRADEIAALEGGVDADGKPYTQVILAGASFAITVRAELGALHEQIIVALAPAIIPPAPKKRSKPNGKRDTTPAPPEVEPTT